MEKLGITVFDVAVVAVAVFGAALGMSSGFTHAVLFIGSWIGAGWVALNYYQVVEPELLKLVQSAELAKFGAMLVVFVAALIILVMLSSALSKVIRMSPLKRPDQILGGAFGVLCAWSAMGLAFLLYGYLGPKQQLPQVVEDSASLPRIKEMANFVEPHLPQGFKSRFTQKPIVDPTISLPEPPKPPQ